VADILSELKRQGPCRCALIDFQREFSQRLERAWKK
jgi:hypothetical protein